MDKHVIPNNHISTEGEGERKTNIFMGRGYFHRLEKMFPWVEKKKYFHREEMK